MRTTDFFTSHEALLLGYEQAMTRVDSTSGDCTPLRAPALDRRPHPPAGPCACRVFPWHPQSDRHQVRPSPAGRPHPPAGHPSSPTMRPPHHPDLCRFGADKVGDHLPALIRAVEKEGRNVVWVVRSMHGNTIKPVPATRRARSSASSRKSSPSSMCTGPREPMPAASI